MVRAGLPWSSRGQQSSDTFQRWGQSIVFIGLRLRGRNLSIGIEAVDLCADRLEHQVESFRSKLLLQLLIMRCEYLDIPLVERCIAAKTDWAWLEHRQTGRAALLTLIHHPNGKLFRQGSQAENLVRKSTHESLVSGGGIWFQLATSIFS